MGERFIEQASENIQISCMPCDLESAREVLYGLGLHDAMIADVVKFGVNNHPVSVKRIFASIAPDEMTRLGCALSEIGIAYGIAKVQDRHYDG